MATVEKIVQAIYDSANERGIQLKHPQLHLVGGWQFRHTDPVRDYITDLVRGSVRTTRREAGPHFWRASSTSKDRPMNLSSEQLSGLFDSFRERTKRPKTKESFERAGLTTDVINLAERKLLYP